ncbi:nucleoside phosphorylase [Neolewinella litorea]|uniref:Uridine phosphorylase n=1 Tax=Neolewinella litorea TaxID=2562452 RepID=A0A4S4NJC4_9BACT|nr:nucleoside phosphorylase [Neolewinella litorea]THH39894.1 phosphorylase [Neolewinella litorea]
MIAPSELILRPRGSVYHLDLLPGQVAETIITVGDPERVGEVSRRFDRVELRVEAREFVTHTGDLNGKRLSVVSTGIGTDNVDIVINELDALFNIDLHRREVVAEPVALTFLRLGTSGSFQPDIPLDTVVLSSAGLSLDGLLPFYPSIPVDESLATALTTHLSQDGQALPVPPVMVRPQLPDFLASLDPARLTAGITLTAAGFYAPQGRVLRLPTALTPTLLEALRKFRQEDLRITNIEMETAGIYALASALGHRSASLSALLANRALGTFSRQPATTVDRLIDYGLFLLTDR